MIRKINIGLTSILLVHLIIFIIAFDIDDPQNCPKGMDAQDKKTCCRNLAKKIRQTSAYDCCEYPRFVIWRWQFFSCLDQCEIPYNKTHIDNKVFGNKRCCHFPCCLKYLKIIGDRPDLDGIDAEGLKFSFLLSTGNDTRWTNVIDAAVDQCNSQYRQDIPQISNTTVDDTYENFWDCFQLVPRYLIAIVDCIYYRNFLSCPTYNDTIFMCPEWRNFVQDCLIDMTE